MTITPARSKFPGSGPLELIDDRHGYANGYKDKTQSDMKN